VNPAPLARAVIVLVPTRGTICAELSRALINNTPGFELVLRTRDRLPVDVARNALAADAIAAANDGARFPAGSDPYVFWIDSDAFFLHGTMTLMVRTLEQHPDIDVLAGLFGPRASERGATAFRSAGDRSSYLVPEVNFTRGDLVDVDLVGLHFLLHRVSLLRSLGPDPFGAPDSPASDDAAFCGRIRHGGGRITVATGVPVFHVDERNGTAYSPGVGACAIEGDAISTTLLGDELPPEERTYGGRIDRATRS
jgi:hypothetical protein